MNYCYDASNHGSGSNELPKEGIGWIIEPTHPTKTKQDAITVLFVEVPLLYRMPVNDNPNPNRN
jgi:hypothetical protein